MPLRTLATCEKKVVEMNPGDALYANLARLSYSASLRAQVSRIRLFDAGDSK